MANTFLTDLDYVPQVFAGYVDSGIRKESRFFNSGIVVDTAALMPALGNTITLPFWNALEGDAEVMSASVPATNALSSGMQVAAILQRVKKYGSNDLVADFSGSDPLQNVGAKVAKFWANQLDKTAMKIAVATADALGAENDQSAAAISASHIIDTRALLGEYVDEAGFMVVHPDILASLQKAELTSVKPGADGRLITMYQGMEIIVSNTLAPVSNVYSTLICRAGSMGYADGTKAEHVLEVAREIGHADAFATQKRYTIHAGGAKWKGTPAGATATDAELANAANWELGASDLNHFGIRILKSLK